MSQDIQTMTRHELIQLIEFMRYEDGKVHYAHAQQVKELQAENTKLLQETERLRHPPIKGTSVQKLRAALKRAVARHGHDYNCSASQGMERDCHCGWSRWRGKSHLRSWTMHCGTVTAWLA